MISKDGGHHKTACVRAFQRISHERCHQPNPRKAIGSPGKSGGQVHFCGSERIKSVPTVIVDSQSIGRRFGSYTASERGYLSRRIQKTVEAGGIADANAFKAVAPLLVPVESPLSHLQL